MFAVLVALAVAAPATGASAQCDSKPFTFGAKPQAKPAAKAPAAPPKLAEAKPPAKKKPATPGPGVPGCKTDPK